jgi:hypothetical protein
MLEPGEVVGPAAGMPWPLAWWQVAVLEFDAGAATVGGEPYFYGAGPGPASL